MILIDKEKALRLMNRIHNEADGETPKELRMIEAIQNMTEFEIDEFNLLDMSDGEAQLYE